jgi:FkbM family methyltransferase
MDEYLKRFADYCSDGELYENVIQSIYECYVHTGEIVVDAGANRGRHTFPLCAAVGTLGRVYAIEPLPHLAALLKDERTRFPQLSVIQNALSDFTGDTVFHHVKNSDYYSGIKRCNYPFEPEIEVLKVSAHKLDDLIPEQQVVSFIKMDLEGGEFAALRGSKRILERDRPLIVFEHAGVGRASSYDYDILDYQRFWTSHGYSLVDLFGRSVNGSRFEQSLWYLVAAAQERSFKLINNLHVPLVLAAQKFGVERGGLILR